MLLSDLHMESVALTSFNVSTSQFAGHTEVNTDEFTLWPDKM